MLLQTEAVLAGVNWFSETSVAVDSVALQEVGVAFDVDALPGVSTQDGHVAVWWAKLVKWVGEGTGEGMGLASARS